MRKADLLSASASAWPATPKSRSRGSSNATHDDFPTKQHCRLQPKDVLTITLFISPAARGSGNSLHLSSSSSHTTSFLFYLFSSLRKRFPRPHGLPERPRVVRPHRREARTSTSAMPSLSLYSPARGGECTCRR
jgi:hypothetical protein